MNQEYRIEKLRVDLDHPGSVFLPPEAKILEVSYEAVDTVHSMIYPIGGIDRLRVFFALKNRFNNFPQSNISSEGSERMRYLTFGFPDPLRYTEIKMIITTLVPVPKPKGKYA